MAGDGLFGDLPEAAAPARGDVGAVRLRRPVRDQVELRACDLDSLLPGDHPARVIWGCVTRLDLSGLEAGIKARAGTPGQPATDPRLLLALWLYAISQGVGSARALAALCTRHDAYRWLCGGVSVNYHLLSDFRTAHPQVLDGLLTHSVAALLESGVIDLEQLAQDGLRVRASAGAGSYRRRGRLERKLAEAQALVAALDGELDADPAAGDRRRRAAQARGARERVQRVERALAALAELEAARARKKSKAKTPLRVSTTDREARVMKLADGGFRPAYNLQVVSPSPAQVVVALDVDASGSDRGWLRPLLEQVHARYATRPARYLADGGDQKNADIAWAHAPENGGVEVYLEPSRSKHRRDPYAPRRRDSPGVAAWRARMATPQGQAIYQQRGPCECVHAHLRQWGLTRLTVRGIAKVRCMALLYALANNILQGHRLERLAAADAEAAAAAATA